jgi:hypothetical protein
MTRSRRMRLAVSLVVLTAILLAVVPALCAGALDGVSPLGAGAPAGAVSSTGLGRIGLGSDQALGSATSAGDALGLRLAALGATCDGRGPADIVVTGGPTAPSRPTGHLSRTYSPLRI